MNELDFKLLNIINNKNELSQREISNRLNISLGKVNGVINKLIEEEMIYTFKKGKTLNYKLSSNALEEFEEENNKRNLNKIKIHDDSFKKITQAVILAAGEKNEFGKPVGMLEIHDTTMFKRMIDILKSNGIQKIVVVAGYESKYFEELKETFDFFVVKNENFKWTGTMASLEKAKKYIDDDFILVENDLIFEDRAIKEVLSNRNRDCLLVTTETDSGDEAFVEIRDGYVVKISKDIHSLNKVDGEMPGILKISYKVYQKMLREYEDNKNKYLNYEYLFLETARNLNIGYTKIDDLVWFEIDNVNHYKNVINKVYPAIKRREFIMESKNLKEYVINALDLSKDDIGNFVKIGGMTNKNYKVDIKGKSYVLRVPGNGTSEMIDRKSENINAKIASDLEIDKPILYMNEVTGVKIAEYISDSETLTCMSSRREENMRLMVELIKRLHNSERVMNNTFNSFELMRKYEDLILKYKGNFYDDYLNVKNKVFLLKERLESLNEKLYPCHNDTLPDNFIKDSKGRMYLIDWEYSGMNDPMWDVAAIVLESDFNKDEEDLFLNIYFDGNSSDNIKKNISERIIINKICQDFLWALWTILKEAQGDDFGSYGIDRYNRALKNLELYYGEFNHE